MGHPSGDVRHRLGVLPCIAASPRVKSWTAWPVLVTTNVTVSPADTVIRLGSNLVVSRVVILTARAASSGSAGPPTPPLRWCPPEAVCGPTSAEVATRAVAATDKQHDDRQQAQDDDDDPEHLHPPRHAFAAAGVRAGVGGAWRVSHARVLLGRARGFSSRGDGRLARVGVIQAGQDRGGQVDPGAVDCRARFPGAGGHRRRGPARSAG
jgi:hypothetical protein